MSAIKIIDILDLLENNKECFKTLRDINIQKDENGEIYFVTEKNSLFINIDHEGKAKIIKIDIQNNNDNKCLLSLKIKENDSSAPIINISQHKGELEYYDNYGDKKIVNVILIDNEPIELLSMIVPHREDVKQNTEIIIEYVKSFLWLFKNKFVLDGFSLDSCFIDKKGKVIFSCVHDMKLVKTVEGDMENVTAFKNFFLDSLLSLILESWCQDIILKNDVFNIKDKKYYNSEAYLITMRNSLKLIKNVTKKELFNISELLICRVYTECLSLMERAIIEFENKNVKAKKHHCPWENEKYMLAGEISENRIPVKERSTKKYGYMNLSGEVVIPFLFDKVGDFYESIAVAKKKELFGAINRCGANIIPFKFTELFWEKRGNVFIFQKDGHYGLLDRKGNVLLEETYLEIDSFNDGCAVVKSEETGKYGVINNAGEEVIWPIYDKIDPFNDMKTTLYKKDKTIVVDVIGDEL
ncbi:MAG: WG repeat-containing protein [Bacteroidetes bacterium]|nr:WG repeat-containing protein [Bacteroidota bacterium]